MSNEARENAYCPYSNFHVGAALLCTNGQVFTGCNVENVSYGLAICAERTAVVKAISEGNQKFKAIAICSDNEDKEGIFTASCGACRQFMIEFNSDLKIYMVTPDGRWKMYVLSDLMPAAFLPKSF